MIAKEKALGYEANLNVKVMCCMNRVALRAVAAAGVDNLTEHIPVLFRFVGAYNTNTTRNNHTETDTNKAKFNITGKILQAVQFR